MTLRTCPPTTSPTATTNTPRGISQARGQVLTELVAGLKALQRAGAGVAELRGGALDDVELVQGRDGRDVATFIDDSIRLGRAAYAVVHAIIDKETP
jgi:hypothetical protein